MEILINSLNKYYENKNNLEEFIPIFSKIFKENKINISLIEEFIEKGNQCSINLKTEIKNTYLRKRLYSNNFFEIILITWGSNTKSLIHHHPKNGCILTLLSNGNEKFIEEKYNMNNKLIESMNFKRGDIGYMHDSIGKHRIINNNENNIYTLHIYSPPFFYNKK